MGGRGRQGRGRGGRGVCGGRESRGRGRRRGHYTATLNKNIGLCSALGNNVFDYGQKRAADQMRKTWEKIFHHAMNISGHDIRNEL